MAIRRWAQTASPEEATTATARVRQLAAAPVGAPAAGADRGAEAVDLGELAGLPVPAAGGWVPAAPDVAGAATGRPRSGGGHWLRACSGAVRERLPAPLRGRLDPGRRGMAVLLVVGLLAVLGTGLLVWRSRPAAVTVAPVGDSARAGVPRSGGSSLPTPRPAAGSPAPGATSLSVTVDVAGKVRQPGVLTLPAGSRVQDAITAAGGMLPGEDGVGLNLARRLADGEQIVVGTAAGAATGSAPPTGRTGSSGSGGKVNLNAATESDLDALPGVGPVLAQRILAWRSQHGRFASVDQLREVGGIGDRKFTDISALVTV